MEGVLPEFPVLSGHEHGEHPYQGSREEELSHYSNATTDLEYLFPFGWGELWGIADRTDFDLKQHSEYSGQEMVYTEPETNEKYIPYCIEPSLGADRVALAFLIDAYEEETLTDANGKEDTRVVLKFHPALAPFKAAVLPLAKKLGPVAEPVYEELSKYFNVDYDAAGSDSESATEERMRSVRRSASV